jgi:flagellin FlaB
MAKDRQQIEKQNQGEHGLTLRESVVDLMFIALPYEEEGAVMKRLLAKIRKAQEGITGLETAIILIAFVIVASVFAYVVLSAGLFSSQKVKEAVSAGIDSTMAALELKGDIIAKMENGEAIEIYVFLGIPSAGTPVDLNPASTNVSSMVITYSDATTLIPSMNWTLTKLSTINDDNLLDPNELFQVTILVSSSGNVTIGPYHRFSLELKPPDGPVLAVQRTFPARVSEYVNLH